MPSSKTTACRGGLLEEAGTRAGMSFRTVRRSG